MTPKQMARLYYDFFEENADGSVEWESLNEGQRRLSIEAMKKIKDQLQLDWLLEIQKQQRERYGVKAGT